MGESMLVIEVPLARDFLSFFLSSATPRVRLYPETTEYRILKPIESEYILVIEVVQQCPKSSYRNIIKDNRSVVR